MYNIKTTPAPDTAPENESKPVLKGSPFRAIARCMIETKLGALLLLSSMINHTQLERALAEQARSGQQLGKILIKQKSVSAVHLYRKLAEQWCLRASTAGLTLIMQLMPAAAQADLAANSLTPHFTLAAAMPAPLKSSDHPGLFGSHEIKSNDITPFKKWTDVMARFEAQMKSVSSTAPKFMLWKTQIQRLKAKSQLEQIQGINAFLNQIPYIEDKDNYGKTDYWATPIEFLTDGGDCEDFAIAKYASLRALGFSAQQLRIAIVQDEVKKIPHALLVVYSDAGTFILDNQDKEVEPVVAVTRYKPIFSINSTSWWLHRA